MQVIQFNFQGFSDTKLMGLMGIWDFLNYERLANLNTAVLG